MEKELIITKMEQALAEVNQVKQQLQKNAAEVKSQIHSGISRQLEALRNREVWLLNQVELIHNMKDEVLHSQQARLNKMLGVAQSGMTDSLENEFGNSDSLKPDENQWISFKCDSAKLRESITAYGRVESGSRPCASVFVKPGHPARSLPPHFEDYDDADHHVLYKTVEGVTKSTGDTKVTFSLPKLSSSSKDWLAYPTTSTSTLSCSGPIFSFPAFDFSNQCWLKETSSDVESPMSSLSSESFQLPQQDTDSSIKMWLRDIKQNPVIEDEDDFEVISRKEFIGMERRSRQTSMASSQSAPDLKFMDHETWLRPGSDVPTSTTKSFKLPAHLETSSTETWLCRKFKRNSKSKCDEKCGTGTTLEIENICDYLDEKIWIKSSHTNNNCHIEDCKANEPCQGPDNCLSSPHCVYSINHNVYNNQDVNMWLLNGGKNIKPTTTTHSKFSEQLRVPPLDDKENIWLRTGSANKRNLEEWKNKPILLDEKDWINKDTSESLPDSTSSFGNSTTWDKVMNFHQQMSTDQWLNQDSDKDETMKDDNQWILKSSKIKNDKNTEKDQWIMTGKEEDMDIL